MPEITLPAKTGGSFKAYMALPRRMPAPAVLVIQEIFGVNEGMRAKCDALAREGFIAACPDLFWRLEPGVELTDKSESEWKKALDLLSRFDVETGIEDLRAAVHTFKGHADCTGRIGCIGYCLGGKMAYLMAARSSSIACSVGYYGVGLQDLLEEVRFIANPLMLHIAEEDKFVPKDAQQKIKAAVSANRMVTTHSYPGMDHAFTRVGGQHYDEAAATLADGRTIAFLQHNLKLAAAA